MPPLLGRPEGQNEMVVDLKDVDLKGIDLKSSPARQNEMVVDLKDVDLKEVDLKDVDLKDVDLKDVDLKGIDLKSPPARQNEMAAAILPKRCPTAIPNSLVFSRLNDYYSQKKSLFVLFDAVAMESVN
ncbi:pentapeptide repeat-containing protein [Duffyella gerundensis]|uniref:pentapeptide repeat-containing protein n=1 Tax=Duffyella gerundensis TaxID=1619313 RepID=UPI0021F6C1C7|nr:pentapeptide repeat-containing protein [Duffyella gerundensis]